MFPITLYHSIGAVNTITREPRDGKLVGYNTDCEASITAIEDALIGNSYYNFLEHVKCIGENEILRAKAIK